MSSFSSLRKNCKFSNNSVALWIDDSDVLRVDLSSNAPEKISDGAYRGDSHLMARDFIQHGFLCGKDHPGKGIDIQQFSSTQWKVSFWTNDNPCDDGDGWGLNHTLVLNSNE
jgi:hypothetical protein